MSEFVGRRRAWVGLPAEDKETSSLAEAGCTLDNIDGYEAGLRYAEDKLRELNE